MAVCTWCDQEMTTARSCSASVLHRNGTSISMIPYGGERGWGTSPRCGDCGVRSGGFHHLGCDIQCCPVCRGQMISCGCRFDEDEGDEQDDGGLDHLGFDPADDPVEVMIVGGQKLIVHTADLPAKDLTVVDGIRCTTALRTIIDIAPGLSRRDLEHVLGDCLHRGLFTVDEAIARVGEADMRSRPGAVLLREVLADRRGS